MKTSFGRELSFPGFTGRIAPDWDTPETRSALADFRRLLEDPRARVLLESRNTVTSVLLSTAPGKTTPAVLKAFGMRGVNRVKTLLMPSKAAKAWRGAEALAERKIGTAPAIAYWESRRHGTVNESYFLTERIEGVREIRFLFRELKGDTLDRLLRDVAFFLAGCHAQGVVHKDLSDGNILVGTKADGGSAFYLLDTNRVRVRRKVGPLARMKNLVRLGVPTGKRGSFLDHYGQAAPLAKRFGGWYKFQKTVYAGRLGLKKKLRLKSLARKLGIQ